MLQESINAVYANYFSRNIEVRVKGKYVGYILLAAVVVSANYAVGQAPMPNNYTAGTSSLIIGIIGTAIAFVGAGMVAFVVWLVWEDDEQCR